MRGHRRISRRTVSTLAVLALQAGVVLAVLLAPPAGTPHRVPITITGPTVVADALAAQADRRPGTPLDAGVAATEDAARADVEQGRSVAALVVDLRRNRATLLVSSAQGDAAVRAVEAEVRAMARPFAARIVVRDVVPSPAGSAGHTGLHVVVAGAVLLGLVIAVVVTWRRGPVADTWREATRRLAVGVGTASGASLLLAAGAAHWVGGGVPSWWVVAVLTALATLTATLALESVLGVAGIGVATLVTVVTAAPLVRAQHELLLPEPWWSLTPWLPHGAALDAGRQLAFYGAHGSERPLAVLLGWIAVAYVLLVIARRERRREGVTLNGSGRAEASGRGGSA